MLKELRLGLFNSSLDLGIAMSAEVSVQNNDSIGCRGSLFGDLCSKDGNRPEIEDLDSDLFVSLRARTSGRPKPMKGSRLDS